MQKIKKGDKVIILAGKDKGKQGLVLKVIYSKTSANLAVKAVVEGINVVKKNLKPDSAKQQAGGIISKEMPIAISNLALFNAKTGKADKVGFKFVNNEQIVKKVRYFKSNQEVVDV